MEVIRSLGLWLNGNSTQGFSLEVRVYGEGLATPLVVEKYSGLSRSELDQVVEATVYTLRPGVGYFDSAMATQEELAFYSGGS